MSGGGKAAKILRGPVVRMVPDGDNRIRDVCVDCGFVHYRNPAVVVGAVVVREEEVLLCRRAIPPREGYWALPAGYLELGESTSEGARREAMEEANADIEIERPLGIYSIPRLSVVQIIFAAKLVGEHIAPGPESHEVGLFGWDSIPRAEIAFPSVTWALDDWRRDQETGAKATSLEPASIPRK